MCTESNISLLNLRESLISILESKWSWKKSLKCLWRLAEVSAGIPFLKKKEDSLAFPTALYILPRCQTISKTSTTFNND